MRRALARCALALGTALALAPAAAADSTLFSGQTLASGQTLTSPDGHYTLTMETDGNLVMSVANPYGSPRVIWSTGTGSLAGAYAQVDASGTFGVFSAAGAPAWTDNKPAAGCVNVDVQTDGNLVAYDDEGQPIWLAGSTVHTMQPGDELLPGQTITSVLNEYELTMTAAGTLVLSDNQGAVWQSPVSGPAGSYAEMNPNGDWEIVSPSGAVAWSTGTTADPGAFLEITLQGAIEVVSSSDAAVWNSGTGASRSGLTDLDPGRPFQSCPVTTPAPAPTPPTTTPPVAVKLPRTNVSIDLDWRYDGATSWITAARVRHFPHAARLRVSCRGPHCPRHRVTVHHRRVWRAITLSADARHVRALLRRLRALRFHAGDAVVFTVSEPHHQTERSEAIIRRDHRPRSRALS